MNLIWIIPLLPGLGAAINGLAGVRYFSRKTAGAVACATMVAALGLSLFACWQLLLLAPDARAYDVEIATWFPTIPLQTHDGIGSLRVPWGFRLDVRQYNMGKPFKLPNAAGRLLMWEFSGGLSFLL